MKIYRKNKKNKNKKRNFDNKKELTKSIVLLREDSFLKFKNTLRDENNDYPIFSQLLQESKEMKEVNIQNLKDIEEKLKILKEKNNLFFLDDYVHESKDTNTEPLETPAIITEKIKRLCICKTEYEQDQQYLKQLDFQLENLKNTQAKTMEDLIKKQKHVEEIRTEHENKQKLLLQKQLELDNIIHKTEELKKINENYLDYHSYLNNEFQEAKGNIRVFCRVRVQLENEANQELAKIEFKDKNSLTIHGPAQKGPNGQREQSDTFKFDYVFSHETTQEQIYHEVSQLVKSALDGYKVCIFAYGQTGSGKTFTMEGIEGNKGIIPRAIEQIFQVKSELKQFGWSYTVTVSVCEIYIDQLRDLLSTNDIGNSTNAKIRKEKNIVEAIEIQNALDWEDLYARANKKRVVAETKMNEHSSRSHLIFQIFLTGKNGNEKKEGALNLIDLAGSERLNKSGVTGIRQKEAIAINKSLSSLKSVILALLRNSNEGRDSCHVPYRESILTTYLQDYFGNNCKTLMFVNISPIASSYSETISSLKFSSDVNKCKINP